MAETKVAGVDGCRAGWVAVIHPGHDPGLATHRIFPDFRSLLMGLDDITVIAIDMPIGLPAEGGHAAESDLRPLLGARQSSLFAMPSRSAVEAPDYATACAASLATSQPPKKISKQAFALFPRIREIDALLRAEPALNARLFECHPEASFRAMRGAPLAEPKKVKSRPHPAGLAERRALLAAAGYAPALTGTRPPAGTGADDLLDACAAAWTAARIAAGQALSYPSPPGRDAHGIPIAIWT
jgi:predicted RNase H-like nuclease